MSEIKREEAVSYTLTLNQEELDLLTAAVAHTVISNDGPNHTLYATLKGHSTGTFRRVSDSGHLALKRDPDTPEGVVDWRDTTREFDF